MRWTTILPALLFYSQASFHVTERGPRLIEFDNSEEVAKLINLLMRANKNPRESHLDDDSDLADEYSSETGSNDLYDIDIKNAGNVAVREKATKSTALKKGQSEYVGFIEPKVSNQMNHKEILMKRVEDHQTAQQTNLKPTLHLSNFLNLAVATMCMLAVVVGIATGSYYFFKDRSQKASMDSCDFTYAPTGPGKSKKKKGGDEGLAYKAQLHHYQQTKQKIISGESGAVTLPDGSESGETSDDENNFSVYECPGLAPTGDIEVQNPNFISQT